MDQTYHEEYTSPEKDLGQDIEFDFDDDEFEDNADLMRILGIAGGVAVLLGGLMLLVGRRRRTPAEQVLDQVTSTGKDVRKAVEQIDLRALLGDALDQVNNRLRSVDVPDLARTVRHAAGDIAQGVGQVDLEAAVNDIQKRLSTIEREGFRGARRAQKEARRAFRNLDLGDLSDEARQQLTDFWDEVSTRARAVGWEQAVDESRKNLRRLSRNIGRGSGRLGAGALGAALAALASQLGTVRDRVQQDVLPGVQGTLQDDVLPQARKRARQAGETLASAAGDARKRGSDLADEYGPQVAKQAGRAADSAKSFGVQVGDLLRGIAVDALDRMMSDVIPGARKGGQRVADTMRDDTFPWLRHRAGEVRDRVQDDVAPRVSEMAAAAPGQVRDAVGVAAPIVGEALGSAAAALGDAFSRARPKVGDAVEGGRARVEDAVKSGSSGLGGALSIAGRRAGDAAGAAVGTTKYVTGETSRILFWLSMLSGLILVIFVPDPERQKEIWNNVQQFLGEIRNMWGDLGADELDAEAGQDYTGDAGV